MKTDGYDDAFPSFNSEGNCCGATGLTKREYMATKLLAALLPLIPPEPMAPEQVAGMAAGWADLLIAALNKK